MLTEEQIEAKYGIVYVGKQRYYSENLAKRDYSLEYSTPLSLDAGGESFIESSWKQLLIEVCKRFLAKYPYKRQNLLNYRQEWNDKANFSSTPLNKNWHQVGEDVYILCNHTAVHACWLLQDILEIFDISLPKCKFIIHRPPGAEHIECRVHYERKTRDAFKYYYTKLLRKPEEKANQVLRNIDMLNKILPRLSNAYNNFYLIDNNNVYASYKARFLDFLRFDLRAEEKNVLLADKYLTILGDFYKVTKSY